MSDLMLLGVLRMPMDSPDPLTLRQFVDRARQAADEIDRLTAEMQQLRADNTDLQNKFVMPLREYLDASQRRAESLRERVAVLEAALRGVLPWVVTQVVACNGLKCREDVCMSCNSDAEDNAQLACNAYGAADAALKGER